jgi:general secretion pathway protein L
VPILKNVLGLDLGSHSIKAVEFRQTLRGLEAVQLRMLPRADAEIPLADLVHRFVRLHRFGTEHVVTALPGDRISSRRLSFPFRERRKLAQAVPFEVEGDLPFNLEDIVVDWEVVGGDRSRAEVVATIAPRTEVSGFLETLREAACEPRTLEAEGLVLGNLGAVFDLRDTRLLVDLGHRKTTLCLLLDGRPAAARIIPVGGWKLTEAVARDRGLSLEDAERAKCEEGIADRALGGLAPEARSVLDRIAREIVRTLGSLETVTGRPGGGSVSELTIFGGTAQLDRIDEYLAERTGIATARLGLPVEDHGEGLVAGGPPILFAPAIALGLRGTTQARTRMNFRQDEFAVRLDLSRFRRELGSTAVIAGVTLFLAVVSFATTTFLESHRAGALEGEINRLYGEVFPGKPVPASALSDLRDAVRSANDRAEFLGVYRGNLSALDLLTEISRRVPEDLDVVFEELTIDRQTIRMRVYAKSFEAAYRLGAELSTFEPFAKARIGAIETDRKRGGKQFNVTISLSALEDRA